MRSLTRSVLLASLFLGAIATRVARSDPVVLPGLDLLRIGGGGGSLNFASSPIPAGFFAPESAPFSGEATLGSTPLGLQWSGNADTTLYRGLPADFGGDPRTSDVEVEVSGMSFESVEPIVVAVIDTGVDFDEYDIHVTLTKDKPSKGWLSLLRDRIDDLGGVIEDGFQAESFFDVFYTIEFTPVGGGETLRLEREERLFLVDPVPWSHAPPTHAWIVEGAPPDATSNFFPGGTPGDPDAPPVPMPFRGDTLALDLVLLENRAPVADAGGPHVIAQGQPLGLDGGASVDPDEDCGDSIVLYEWDLDDDGVFDVATADSATTLTWPEVEAFGLELADPATHLPTHPVALRVTDSLGRTDTADTTLRIYPPADHETLPGLDLLRTDDGAGHADFADEPIPPDFFGPGSEPFSGEITFGGEPANPGLFGGADTLVRRSDPSFFDGDPLRSIVPTELVELSLVSTQPITVSYTDGPTTTDYDAPTTLTDGLPSPGRLDLRRAGLDDEGGTIDDDDFQPESFFDVFYTIEFTPVGGGETLRLDRQERLILVDPVPWSHAPPTHAWILEGAPPGATSNFFAGGTPGDPDAPVVPMPFRGDTLALDLALLENRAPVADPGGPHVIAQGQPLRLDGSGSVDPDEDCGDSIVLYEWDLDEDGVFDVATADPAPTLTWPEVDALGLALADPATHLPVHPVRLRVTDSLGRTDTADTTLRIDRSAVLSIGDALQTEGDDGGTTLFSFLITRVGDAECWFDCTTKTGGTATSGDDYTAVSPATFHFLKDGPDSLTFQVTVKGDNIVELSETFLVALANPVGATVDDDEGQGTIINDDQAKLSIDDVTGWEDDAHPAGTVATDFVFTVTLDRGVDVPLGVTYQTADGDDAVPEKNAGSIPPADEPEYDFAASSGTLAFQGVAGESQTITISVFGDRYEESDEWFSVLLKTIQAGARNVVVDKSKGIGTIRDDDQDSDRDGIPDIYDKQNYLENNPDTDGDGYLDGMERAIGSSPTDPNSPSDSDDLDRDGIPDYWERIHFPRDAVGTADADDDGILDSYELAYYGDLHHQIFLGDIDGDGTVDMDDVWLITQVVGYGTQRTTRVIDYDIDLNGKIDMDDVMFLQYFVNGNPIMPHLPYTPYAIYNHGPRASLDATPNPAACGQNVTFDGSSSYHPYGAGTITRYEWDLDDDGVFEISGTSMTVVSHAFSAFGSYDVTLRVRDDAIPERTDEETVTVVVDQGNRPPVADAGGPYLIDEGADLALDGSASSDPDGGCGDSIVLYEWDLDDDGVFDDASGATPALPWTSVDALGLGITDPLTHLPTHPVGLRVTDSLGKTGIADTTLRVYRNAPEASFGANPNPAACGQDVTFDGSGSRHGHPGRTITRYEWDLDGDSVFEVSGTSMTVVSHAFSAFGSYDVTLRVTDDNVPAKTDTAMVTVVVDQGNRPPVADAGGPYVVEEDQMLELDGSGSSDPDGGCGDSIVKYEWDLNDDAVFDDALGATPTVFWADLEALGLAPANVATGLPTHTVRLRTTDSLGLVHVATAVLTMYEFEWLFPMTVSGGSVSELAFGMAVGATDGSDDVLDQPVTERSRDALPETIFSGRDGVALWRDVRRVSDCALWLMEVQAAADNDCVLSWSAGSVPGAGLRLVETDETGEVLPDGVQLDMAVRETVTILAGEMQFFLIVHGQYERTITLAIGWNLISFPFNLWVPDLVEVLGDLPILLPVWEWTGRQYAPMSGGDRFQPKRGYWVYVAPATGVAEELVATGFPCWDETGAVTPGAWNLVGALEECAEPVSARNGMALWHWQADARSYAKISDDGVVPVAKGLWLFFADSGGQQLIDFTTFEFVLSAK